jgi:glycine cleavage system H protein
LEEIMFKKSLLGILVTVAGLSCLPLLAAIGLTLQLGFVLAVPVLLVAALLVPSVREFLGRTHTILFRGVRLASDVSFSPTHSWVRCTGPKLARIGADDFMQRVFGRVDAVELPPVGAHVRRGEMLVCLHHGSRTLELVAPVDGVVRQTNLALGADPAQVNRAPFGDGWLVELGLREPATSLSSLFTLGDAMPWMRDHFERLVALSRRERHAPTLADGGELTPDVAGAWDADSWEAVRRALFSPA